MENAANGTILTLDALPISLQATAHNWYFYCSDFLRLSDLGMEYLDLKAYSLLSVSTSKDVLHCLSVVQILTY